MARNTEFSLDGDVGTYTILGATRSIPLIWSVSRFPGPGQSFAARNPTVSFGDSRGNRQIQRALFSFDFTEPRDGQAPQLHNIRRIKTAEVTLNITNVSAASKIYLGYVGRTASTRLTGADCMTTNIKGYDRSSLTSSKLAWYQSISSTGDYTWELPPAMIAELKDALRIRGYFNIIALDYRDLNSTTASVSRVSSASTIEFNNFSSAAPPKIKIEYFLDNNRFNHGAGISRASKSGFMLGNIFSGTNTGFSS